MLELLALQAVDYAELNGGDDQVAASGISCACGGNSCNSNNCGNQQTREIGLNP